MSITQFPQNLKSRENYIFDQIQQGNYAGMLTQLSYIVNGKQVELLVMEDALTVNGVRVNVSAAFQQKLADLFDASLPTAMIADLMYVHAVRRADPCPMKISSSVETMVAHSNAVGKQLVLPTGLASTTGKHWILDKKLEQLPGRACNYGWHFTGSSYKGINGFPNASGYAGKNVKVIQPNATAHDSAHSDYSQICQLVSQKCWINGSEHRLSDVLKDANLALLVSHTGSLKLDRQPGVILYTGTKIQLPVRLPTVCQPTV